MTEDAQPQEGQGTTPYDSYLESVPEGAQEAAQQWFADTSKGINQKLEEAADFRRQWEPYQGIDLPPAENLSELIEWSNQTLTDQETFDRWITEQAESKGLTQPQAEEVADEVEGLAEQGLNPEQIQSIIAEQNAPIEERLAEMEFLRGA